MGTLMRSGLCRYMWGLMRCRLYRSIWEINEMQAVKVYEGDVGLLGIFGDQ